MFKLLLKEYFGKRIDNILFVKYPFLPKSLIYKSLRTGKIKVNNIKVMQSYKVLMDDTCTIPLYLHNDGIENITIPPILPELNINSIIVLENDAFLIVNKPCNLPVHKGTKCSYGIIDYLPNFYLTHRLDKEVSGCLIISKTLAVVREFSELFRNQVITKIYLAVVIGIWPKNKTVIHERIDGKFAETYVKIIKSYENYTVLEIRITTGRKRQIRSHLYTSGFPIIGDSKFFYNDNNYAASRLLLHSYKVEFSLNSVQYTATAPLCKIFHKYLPSDDLYFTSTTDKICPFEHTSI